ncbi:Glycosyl transferase family 2 [Algoriella xinjiangensis]|uniref:Glycosyl transferase family 2 n=1 Tax=Algoriella xinjiangensis TaxID=684065 RepID=A0A1I4YIY7_9FLAO|nr:glycosyltransferase family 2 protein [Algoriella xinjiangensis]SFN37985.1 Glycosyl transferase family 2 [Algoriella xinjiangensis]VDH17375.1 Hyaluronan synthase [Algoriella xinjiangensis]
MEKVKVSIIIPVYKPGNLIHDCIKSLINQSFKSAEFIFVNDGSPDNVQEILNEYQKKDERIKLLEQKNQGISIARNQGIKMAKGDYIGFLDNDDYYKVNFIEELYSKALKHNLDIIISRTIESRDNKKIVKAPIFQINKIYNQDFSSDKIIKNLLIEESLFPVWNKLYKKELINKYDILFPSNREIEEDCMFNLQAFKNAEKIMFIDYFGYYYRDVSTSESRRFIERDLFAKAIEKYKFDYNSAYNLDLDKKEIERLKSIRLINRATYLSFICSKDNNNFNINYSYVKSIISNPILIEILNKYKNDPLLRVGKYDRILQNIILKQNYFKLKIICFSIYKLYTQSVSEFLRNLNGTNKNIDLILDEN